MSDLTIQTVAQVATIAAAADPQAAAALQMAPVALQLLQAAQTMASAGAMSQEQLAALWAQIGQGISSAHNTWLAMNAAQKVA